jgi:hypothetical protein
MANDVENANGATARAATKKRRIFLNGFDMFTVGHLSFGQWRDPTDRSATKRRDLSYWTDLARLLEKGDFNALFLADTYGQYDVYRGSAEPCIRTAAQFPMGDPAVVSPKLIDTYAMLTCQAHHRHGSSNEEPRIRDYDIDVV